MGPQRPAIRGSVVVAFCAAALLAPALSGNRRGLTLEQARAEETPRRLVFVAPIEGVIDGGLAPFVERVLERASAERASAVILHVNTLGGRLDAAVAIRDDLLKSQVRTIAFVDSRAISAGALITLAAKEVVIGPGATIGAATPVAMGQGGQRAATDEKTVSYVRKEFAATAERRGRPVALAEAMVDPDVDVPGVAPKGKLLTLTTEEALRRGIADRTASNLDELLSATGLAGAVVEHVQVNWAERVVRWLTHPVVSSLLMTIAVFGIMIELRTPGLGLPGLVGVLALASFFWGHWLVRLAGWEELLLFGAGVALLLAELFLVPGFGILGAAGIVAILGGLTLSLVGAGVSTTGVLSAATRVALSLAAATAGGLLLLRLLPRLPYGRNLVLSAALPAGAAETLGTAVPVAAESPTSAPRAPETGVALTPLRPAGMAELGGQRIDVVSEGDYVPAGVRVAVVRREGGRVVVRRDKTSPHTEGAS